MPVWQITAHKASITNFFIERFTSLRYLPLHQLRKEAAFGYQFVKGSRLCHPARLHDNDAVTIPDGGKAMRHNDAGSLELVEAFGDNRNVPMPNVAGSAWNRLYGAGQAWKHSDIKNRPYQVVRDVFLSIIEKGNLR